MRKWEWDDYEEQPMCECGIPVKDMTLKMTYSYNLEVHEYMPIINTYGAAENYGLKTQLVCSCGKTYKEDEDYRIEWTKEDHGWRWTLEIETEKS